MPATGEISAAWEGVLDEDRRSQAPDVIGFADVRAAQIAGMPVPPVPVAHIPIPRRVPAGATRALHVLGPIERATYRALVARVAPQIETRLSGVVAAERVHVGGDGLRLVPWRRARERYVALVRRLLSGRPGALVTADVRDCFARIRPWVVAEVLRTVGCRRQDVRGVGSFLTSMESAGVRGLPVGPEPSAVLANAVLTVADRSISRGGGRYVRWVDDYVIGADGDRHAEELLEALRASLAEVGLEIAGEKSRVLGREEARAMSIAQPSAFGERCPQTIGRLDEGDGRARLDAGAGLSTAARELATLRRMGERGWGVADAASLLPVASDVSRPAPVRAWAWRALARTDPQLCLLAGEDAVAQDPRVARAVVAAIALVSGRRARRFLRHVLGRRDELRATAAWALAVGPEGAGG